MGSPIPAWGLYRLLKGIEAKGISGHLEVATADGPVSFGLRKGRIYQAESEVPALGFGSYLVRARMVPDPAAAERLASTRRLIDAGVIRAEDASKLHGSYARSVLSKVLSLPATDWSCTPTEMLMGVVSDHPVDPFPELLRAVARDGQIPVLRAVVDRLRAGGHLVLAPGFEFALSHAKSHFGELRVLSVLRPGRPEDMTDDMLDQEDTVRVLFALIVSGLLHGVAGEGHAHAPPPAPRPAGAPAPGDRMAEPRPASAHDSPNRPKPASPRRPTWMGPQDSIQLAGVSNPFEKELRSAWNEMQARNHFEVLGVPVDARESSITTAYLKARAQFARAKYEDVVPVEAMELVDKILQHLEAVCDVLCDRTRRNAYNRQMGISTPSLDTRVVEIAEARAVWRAGVDLLEEHRPAEAAVQFEAALRQDPHEPEYKVYQAWAILAMPPSSGAMFQARALVEEALKVEPDLVQGLACLGSISRMEGKVDAAREYVRRALALDPDNAQAREVRELLRPRAGAPKMSFQKSPSSLVDRIVGLFKKGP